MHILLVEDHGDSRTVFGNLLIHCGHTVAMAGNLQEALDLLGQMQFDLLLSDIGLPDGEAFQLVQNAKALQRVRKAVAMTGRDRPNDREMSRQAGFDHYLTKPVDFHALREVLAECEDRGQV